MSDTLPAPILLLCRDLMFVSKVTATARAKNRPLRVIRDPAQLPPEGTRLLVDLNQDGAIPAAAAWKSATAGEVIAFVSHVDTDTIQHAKSAGLDQVLTRGRFTAMLDDLVGG